MKADPSSRSRPTWTRPSSRKCRTSPNFNASSAQTTRRYRGPIECLTGNGTSTARSTKRESVQFLNTTSNNTHSTSLSWLAMPSSTLRLMARDTIEIGTANYADGTSSETNGYSNSTGMSCGSGSTRSVMTSTLASRESTAGLMYIRNANAPAAQATANRNRHVTISQDLPGGTSGKSMPESQGVNANRPKPLTLRPPISAPGRHIAGNLSHTFSPREPPTMSPCPNRTASMRNHRSPFRIPHSTTGPPHALIVKPSNACPIPAENHPSNSTRDLAFAFAAEHSAAFRRNSRKQPHDLEERSTACHVTLLSLFGEWKHALIG